jgi:hypothetical protein
MIQLDTRLDLVMKTFGYLVYENASVIANNQIAKRNVLIA